MRRRAAMCTALLATILALSLAPPLMAGGEGGARTVVEPATGMPLQALAVAGSVHHDSRGYFIRGTSPAEIFRITNPNPANLDELVVTGKTVKLQVRSVVGDNVAIEAIDGTPYAAP